MTKTEDAPGRQMEWVSLDDLRPHPENPKTHDLEQIKDSIRRWGFAATVLVDERTGYMAAGHGRCEALLEMRRDGEDVPEGVRADGDHWLVPMLAGWASRDDEELLAFLVADNQATIRGGWDDRALAALLSKLSHDEDSSGLTGVGFTDEDLSGMLAKLAPPAAPTAFPAIDPDTLATEHRCPSCGYEWSGNPKPGEPTHEPGAAEGDGDAAAVV
jgi:hypothetical protein